LKERESCLQHIVANLYPALKRWAKLFRRPGNLFCSCELGKDVMAVTAWHAKSATISGLSITIVP